MICRASCTTAHQGVFGHCDKAGLRNYNVHPSNYLHVPVDSNVAHSKSIAPSAVWYVIVLLQNLQVFMSHNLVGFHRTFYLQFLDWKTTHCRDKFCRNESCPTDDPSLFPCSRRSNAHWAFTFEFVVFFFCDCASVTAREVSRTIFGRRLQKQRPCLSHWVCSTSPLPFKLRMLLRLAAMKQHKAKPMLTQGGKQFFRVASLVIFCSLCWYVNFRNFVP